MRTTRSVTMVTMPTEVWMPPFFFHSFFLSRLFPLMPPATRGYSYFTTCASPHSLGRLLDFIWFICSLHHPFGRGFGRSYFHLGFRRKSCASGGGLRRISVEQWILSRRSHRSSVPKYTLLKKTLVGNLGGVIGHFLSTQIHYIHIAKKHSSFL